MAILTVKNYESQSSMNWSERSWSSDIPFFTKVVQPLFLLFSRHHKVTTPSCCCYTAASLVPSAIQSGTGFKSIIIINGENETFCVEWGLNEDNFGTLVLMRTKSSIEDLFERTEHGFYSYKRCWGCWWRWWQCWQSCPHKQCIPIISQIYFQHVIGQ